MSGIVLDASVIIARLLGENEERERVDRSMAAVVSVGAWVPQLWHYEVRNSLLMAERQGRIDQADTANGLDSLIELPVQTDESLEFEAVLPFARRHGLTYYDAVYVELAVRLDAALATLDQAMMRAAEAEGVPVS